MQDGSHLNEFEGRNKQESASTVELTILYDLLADHYSGAEEDLELFENGKDLGERDDKALIELFDKLSDFYSFGGGTDNPYADDLWMVYEALEDAFDPESR